MEPTTPNAEETPEQRDIRLNKDVAAFSYVWIMSVVVFASRRDSPFIQYHAKQALVLFIISIPVAMIPFLGRYLVFIVLAGMLLGFINAANGRREEIPVVGDLASGKTKPQDLWKDAKPYWDKFLHVFSQVFRKPEQKPKEEPKKEQPAPAMQTPPPAAPQPPLDNTPPKP